MPSIYYTKQWFLVLGTIALIFLVLQKWWIFCWKNTFDNWKTDENQFFSPRKLPKTIKCAIKNFKFIAYEMTNLNRPLIALGDCKCSVVPCYPHPQMCSTSVQTPKLTTTNHEKGILTIMMTQTVRLIQNSLWAILFSRFIHPWQPTHTPLPDSSPTHEIRSKQHYTNLSAIPHQSGTLKLGQGGEGDGRELGGHVGSWCLSPTSRWLTDCHQQLANRWTGVWIWFLYHRKIISKLSHSHSFLLQLRD